MYTQEVDLCRRLLREFYGPVVEAVATALLVNGRLHLGGLIAKAKLGAASVRQALVVLIQHGLVTHAASREGSRSVTFYTASLRSILRLQRSGLYLALMEERVGKDGVAVFRSVMLNGCMAIGSVRDALGFKNLGAVEKQQFNTAVAKLVRERFITAVTAKDTVTMTDRVMQAEEEETRKVGTVPTAKELQLIRRKINDRDEEEYLSSNIVGLKRQAPTSASAADGRGAKSKIMVGPDGRPFLVNGNGEVSNGIDGVDGNGTQPDADADLIDDKQCFRVYHERLDVLLRNKQIVNYFADRYNDGVAAIAKAILRLTESHTKTCRHKLSETLSAQQIIRNVAPDTRLEDFVDMGGDLFWKGLDGGDGDGDGAASGRAARGKAGFALLEILCADVSGIVSMVDERANGQYRVYFDRAAATLRDQSLDALILERFGSLHARIVRVLRSKHKLDEKTVSQLAMLPLTKTRERLHELSLEGFVSTVEMPRAADRHPSRMVYLWYVNPVSQVAAALRCIFQGISNAIQRTDHENRMSAALVTKSKRDDVMADHSLLSPGELEALEALRSARQKLDIAAIRLDGMLLVVHDIAPPVAGVSVGNR
ncbi:RNA polymerase III subunit C82 [Coemansia sp. RSA 552]|nr:RNA polymerase III subunit C82 [Coemansia sp. RSA 552]